MTEINFGPSQYVRNCPGEPLKDNVVNVPDQGTLPTVGPEIKVSREEASRFTTWINLAENWALGTYAIPHYAEILDSPPRVTVVQGFPGVSLVAHSEKVREHEEILLVWIEARREWVAIYKNKWYEGPEGGDDESYLGPFTLDESCSRKLFQAYGVLEDALPHSKAKTTHPEELRGYARKLG